MVPTTGLLQEVNRNERKYDLSIYLVLKKRKKGGGAQENQTKPKKSPLSNNLLFRLPLLKAGPSVGGFLSPPGGRAQSVHSHSHFLPAPRFPNLLPLPRVGPILSQFHPIRNHQSPR